MSYYSAPMLKENPIASPREDSLFRRGEIYLASPSFRKRAERCGKLMGFSPVIPSMIPVRFNGRLKAVGGLYCTTHIEIAKGGGPKRITHTLRHELIHHFEYSNHALLLGDEKDWDKIRSIRSKWQKICFIIFGHGGVHDAYIWKYKMDCGIGLKIVERQKSYRCFDCGKTHLVIREYRKMERMAKVKSSVIKIEMEKYGLMTEEKLIDI